MDQSGWGSSHATTWVRATLQLAMYELQYVLQDLIINKMISNKQLILVFLLYFSVALAQKTTVITTTTAMAATGRNGPLAPHMTPSPLRRRHKRMGNNPPSKRMYFLGGLRVCMALKADQLISTQSFPNQPSAHPRATNTWEPIPHASWE
jgi:hypothetical protein